MKTVCKECKYFDWMSTECEHESNQEPDYVHGGFNYRKTPSAKNPLGECKFFEPRLKRKVKKILRYVVFSILAGLALVLCCLAMYYFITIVLM